MKEIAWMLVIILLFSACTKAEPIPASSSESSSSEVTSSDIAASEAAVSKAASDAAVLKAAEEAAAAKAAEEAAAAKAAEEVAAVKAAEEAAAVKAAEEAAAAKAAEEAAAAKAAEEVAAVKAAEEAAAAKAAEEAADAAKAVASKSAPKDATGTNYLSKVESKIIDMINEERAADGLGELTYNADLRSAARIRSRELCKAGKFSHKRPNGDGWETVIKEDVPVKFHTAGENLCMTQYDDPNCNNATSASFWFNEWVNSPPHYENMMNGEFNQVGVGVYYVVKNGMTYAYATTIFAYI